MGTIVYGHFTDEPDLLNAVKALQAKDIQIADVRTPFPVHGLDTALKYRRSHLPKVAFVAGAVGAILMFWFQAWVNTVSWPLIFGGKPYFSVLSFIPPTFEISVLFAAFGLVFAFLISSNLGPGSIPDILDEEVTDDHFQIILSAKENRLSENKLAEALEATGALDVKQVNPKK
jgi:hypothetical protein